LDLHATVDACKFLYFLGDELLKLDYVKVRTNKNFNLLQDARFSYLVSALGQGCWPGDFFGTLTKFSILKSHPDFVMYVQQSWYFLLHLKLFLHIL
jgi:hypothetical protein